METTDLTVQVNEDGYINVRANLILIHPHKGILFHTLPSWNGELTLFGGRMKLGETLADACARELAEELNLTLELTDSWWEESIFVNTFSNKYEGKIFHEFSGFGVYQLPAEYDVKTVVIDGVEHTCAFVPAALLTSDAFRFVPPKLGTMISRYFRVNQ